MGSTLSFQVPERSLEVLEWGDVQAMVSGLCRTPQGQSAALLLQSGQISRNEATLRAKASLELLALWGQSQMILPLGDIPELGNIFKRISRSGSMAVDEFANLVRFHRSAQALHHFHLRYSAKLPALHCLLAGIELLEPWSRKHFALLDPQGQLVDSASEDLRALRSLTKDLHEQIRRRLDDFLHNPKLAEIMQDYYVTVRDGRYVIPVKVNFRARVPGIVHDVSNTEQTLYIEPQEIVEWNNQLKVAEKEIEKEIERIMAEVVEATKPQVGALERNLELIVRADLASAGAKLLELWQGKGTVGEWGASALEVHELFHPILAQGLHAQGREVVTNSFAFNQALVLTGPNTGGKTVLLKALGLAILMAESGLPAPARSLQLPDDMSGLRADIGDDQSLEKNLSTFSGHLQVLREMIERTRSGELVLIDEIATGTSPEDGQPLAQAVIEEILNRGVRVFVTTHYGGLKQFAMVDDRCRIAAMAFDNEKRRPTYKIELDIPGDSSAFEIAEQLGLPGSVIARARSLKGEVSVDLSKAIEKLEIARKRFREREEEAAQHALRAQEREAKAQEKILELEARMRESLSSEAREMLKKFNALRDELSQSVKQASSEALSQGANPLFVKIAEAGDQVRQAVEGVGVFDPRARSVQDADLQPESVVEVEGFGLGTVVERPRELSKGPKTPVLVQVGDLQVTVMRARLLVPAPERANNFKVSRSASAKARERRASDKVVAKSGGGSNVCDIRGRSVEEGMRRVEVALNELHHNEDAVITIIHGHGSDRLKDAIREYIRKERTELCFRPGTWPGEGGDGVTLVERAIK